MIDTIIGVFNKVKDTIIELISQVADLPDRLNEITFTEDNVITTFLGAIHYILGTPLYYLFCLTLLIGSGFILYHIGKTIINVIGLLIPKIKGMFIIP